MPILAAGMTCQFANAELAPMDSMGYFIQNALDLIEFANGDVNTKWGKVRADMGHPKPFNLKYLGVGNENWDQIFLDRYLVIDRGIRAKHPEIKIISSAGAGPSGPRYDLAWKFLTENKADLVDEHYYVSADWLLKSTTRYDTFDRKGPKVYSGEYACHLPNRANSLYSALCEAAMMTGFERNSDVVVMSSYAPLFGKVAHDQWKPDLIWYDNVRSFGSPNFYVQKLFASNLPATLIPSECIAQSVPLKAAGCVGNETLYAYTPDLKGWSKTKEGKWIVKDGALRQTVPDKSNTGILIGDPTWSDYTLTLKARKISGEEGFIVRFRDNGSRNVHLNLGGWGNQSHGIEAGQGNIIGGKKPGHIENDKWYDIKVVLNGTKVSAWLNDEVICKDVVIETASGTDFFTVSGYDKDAGEIVVKCINVAEADRPLKLDFGTHKLQAQKAKRITLSGDANMVNDLDNPTRCAPIMDTVDVAGGSLFTTTLKPMSMTVFRFKQ
jgi:alpha-L-arabinofuranosidase